MDYNYLIIIPKNKQPSDAEIVDRKNHRLFFDVADDVEDCVFMIPKMYEEIFEKKWKEQTVDQQLMSIVKISYRGNAIYKRYHGISPRGFKKNDFAISYRSMRMLFPDQHKIEEKDIKIEVGEEENYFNYNSNHATRMSYRLSKISNSIGKTSLITSILSFFISIISLIITFKINN